MLANLVEVHMSIGGPVEELMIAIDEFMAELVEKKRKEMLSWELLVGEHLDAV